MASSMENSHQNNLYNRHVMYLETYQRRMQSAEDALYDVREKRDEALLNFNNYSFGKKTPQQQRWRTVKDIVQYFDAREKTITDRIERIEARCQEFEQSLK
jgi:hypothetical protein